LAPAPAATRARPPRTQTPQRTLASPRRVTYASTMAQVIAILMTEEFNEKGERVGYIDLFDPERGETVGATGFDDTKFVTESEARRLADERGWLLRVE
jgi:hypothetical protein